MHRPKRHSTCQASTFRRAKSWIWRALDVSMLPCNRNLHSDPMIPDNDVFLPGEHGPSDIICKVQITFGTKHNKYLRRLFWCSTSCCFNRTRTAQQQKITSNLKSGKTQSGSYEIQSHRNVEQQRRPSQHRRPGRTRPQQ